MKLDLNMHWKYNQRALNNQVWIVTLWSDTECEPFEFGSRPEAEEFIRTATKVATLDGPKGTHCNFNQKWKYIIHPEPNTLVWLLSQTGDCLFGPFEYLETGFLRNRDYKEFLPEHLEMVELC